MAVAAAAAAEEPAVVDVGATGDEEPVAQEPIDVLVEGQRASAEGEDSRETTLGPREVSRMPGAFGDAFRAVDALPGVSPIATGLPHLFVRGATPSATGYFIDGIRVPFLFHLAIGPSVINPAIVEDVSFHPGAYPARYGRHVGGIVAATMREPSGRLRLEGSARLFDAGVFAEVPLLDADLTIWGGGRYSYTAPLLSLAAPDTTLSYWDYQTGAWYALSARDRIGLFAFGSRDHLGHIKADDTEEELFGVEFHRVHARLERRAKAVGADPNTPAGASARLGFTFGLDRSNLADDALADARNYQLRSDVELPLSSWFRLRGGLDLAADEYEFISGATPVPESEEPDPGELSFKIEKAFASRDAGTVGFHLDAVVTPIDALEIIGGTRVDLYAEQSSSRAGVDPRGMLVTRPFSWLSSVSAIGLMHQKPSLLIALPGLDPVGLDQGLQSSLQMSQALVLQLPEEVTGSVTGFHHSYDDLSDLSATCGVGVVTCIANARADGRAYGLELMLRRPFSTRLGLLVSYTLSRSERSYQGRTFTADFDRTHIFNAALGIGLGRGWNAGGRFTAYSGRPHSFISFDDPEVPHEATLIGHRNALRRPSFYRLDLRVEKRWIIADRGWVSLVLEGFNVTLNKELVDFDCRVAEVVGSQVGLSCGGQEVGPISIPSIGVAGGI